MSSKIPSDNAVKFDMWKPIGIQACYASLACVIRKLCILQRNLPLTAGLMKFIADRMLGKLAKLLRLYGYDILYSNKIKFDDVLRLGRQEERIILTRNTLIKKRKGVCNYLFIEDNDPKKQLDQVKTSLNLEIRDERVFTRCLSCNCELRKVERKDVEGKVPDYIYEAQSDFSLCAVCERIFWKGTHYERMLVTLQEVSS